MAVRPARLLRLVPCTLALLVAGGTTLSYTGVTPWVLWIASALAIAVGLSALMPMALAAAGAIVIPFALWVSLARALQPLPVGIDVKATAVLTVLGMAGIAMTAAFADRLPRPGQLARRTVIALAPVAAVILALVVYMQLAGARAVTWAMHNDAVWNTVATRLMIADGGIDTSTHPNPSPATAALMAAATSVGRGDLPSDGLLLHDVLRQGQFWLLAMLATSLLTALIVAPRTRKLGRIAGPLTTGAASLLPLSWFVAGNAMQFGFINGTLALALLLSGWIAWEHLRVAPWAALLVLSAVIVALLAAWAPVAIVPMALVAASFADLGEQWWRSHRLINWVALGFLATPVATYLIAVTLADFRAQGDALGADGGIFALRPEYLLLTCVAVGLGAVVLGVRGQGWRDTAGVIGVISSSTLALAYLVYQRSGADFVWGYYLAKFSWLVMTLLLVIGAATALSLIALERRMRGLLVLGVAGLLLAVMMLLPPTSSTLVPLAAPAGIGEMAGSVQTNELLFALSDVSQRHLVAAYFGPADDGFVNGWLIQIQTTDGADPIRAYAYVLDGTDAAQVCAAAEVWGGDVLVHTRTPEMASALALCESVSRVIVD